MPLSRFDPATYAVQLDDKVARFKRNFAAFDLPEPTVFHSAPTHYRLRAEFRLWHQDDSVHYAMFNRADPKTPVLLDDFPVASKRIVDAMPQLRAALNASKALSRKVFQVDFLSTLSGELMVTLIYHRPLDDEWEGAARQLASTLDAQLIGRSRKQHVVLDRNWVIESFELDGRHLVFQQVEGSFTQPNGGMNRHMLNWARTQARQIGGDLLELYCGNGNFTIALAPLFGKVLATEMSKPSVRAAEYNLEANQVNNVTMVRMSSQEISDALAGGRRYRRLTDIDLGSYQFSTLFVDPPRAGLDEGTLALARSFEHILYVSCNPNTLHDNVAALHHTHRIVASAAFDQFPYTDHLECGLLLARR